MCNFDLFTQYLFCSSLSFGVDSTDGTRKVERLKTLAIVKQS